MHSVGFIQLVVAVLVVIFANSDQKADFFLAGSDLFSSQKVMASHTGLLVWLLVSLEEILQIIEFITIAQKELLAHDKELLK